ncbi:RHS repeat-associated core domain-containing protein, partial [Pinirhizobacter sp.]|uniref:RHS repeat-associated core domain-containing protein n=1 Tax=Pinirhizobacter sp. TaxID=2950432 RepID=UPI002F3F4055
MVTAAETVTYYYSDHQGTVLATANASGAVTSSSDYRPYGTQTLGSPSDGPGYAGHVDDVDSSLVYMQARYYDPGTGGFLSVDPVGLSPGNIYSFNRYGYASNNPIMNIDPDG